MTLEQNANKAFDEYCQEKTTAYLWRWYQAECLLSSDVKVRVLYEKDMTIDGYSRFVEDKTREARLVRTGLDHTQKLVTPLQLVA